MNFSPPYCRENWEGEVPGLCLLFARIRLTWDTDLYNEGQQQLVLSQQRDEKGDFNSSPGKKGDLKTLLATGKQLARQCASLAWSWPQSSPATTWSYPDIYSFVHIKFRNRLSEDIQSM